MKLLLPVVILIAAATVAAQVPQLNLREYAAAQGYSFKYDANTVEHRGSSVHFWSFQFGLPHEELRRSVEIDCPRSRMRYWFSYTRFGYRTEVDRGRTKWTSIEPESPIGKAAALLCPADIKT
jgi:hypothetical protein